MVKYIPNCITTLRIFGTFALIFTKPLSLWFYIIYALTGVTDVLDGFIARKFNLTSKFGALLDSIADLLFYSVMMVMIIPVLLKVIPTAMWYTGVGVLLIRAAAYVTAAIKFHRFASTHSILNKITGGAVFATPFILMFPFANLLLWVVCAIGATSSLRELVLFIKADKEDFNCTKKIP